MMTQSLYTLLLRLLAPLVWLVMARRARRAGGSWDILSRERFGNGLQQAPVGKSRVWVHAVSLGETRAAQPLVQALLDAGHSVLLTHFTATGRNEGKRIFAAALAAGRMQQAWLPYDFPGAMRRFLTSCKPRCGILIEREVWPNLIREADIQGVPMLLVSARFSESSLRQSRWFGPVLRRAYARLELVLAQTQVDADRLSSAGARKPEVCGNLKFDSSPPISQLEAGRDWRNSLGRPIVAVASTREGEDAMFASAIRELVRSRAQLATVTGLQEDLDSPGPVPLFLLIPRHPQRFEEAAAILRDSGLAFLRRSGNPPTIGPDTEVLLGDTLGEMAFYYASADVGIVAGGFAPFGGQNLIEACAAGTAVIFGPHMHNFAQAAKDALEARAALQVADARAAVQEAIALIGDVGARTAMQRAALAWTAAHAGVATRIMARIQPWLGRSDEALPGGPGPL